MNLRGRALMGAAVLAALNVATTAVAPAAQAASATVVISEVYGGGGNSGATFTNDFIELYNGSGSPVSLAGWSVQYASATPGTSWSVTPLSGSIAPGAHYLIQEAAGAGGTTPLPSPDATGSIAMGGTAGKVALVSSTTPLTGTGCPQAAPIVDFVGYGTTANCSETAPTGNLSNTTSARRVAGAVDTDNNAVDFSVGAPDPRTPADQGPSVTSTTPADGATGVLVGANISITFSENVNTSAAAFSIACAGGARTATLSGGPATYTLDPDADLPVAESCTVTIQASGVADADATDPPDNLAANVAFSFSTEGNVCAAAFTPIPAIQGSGLNAAITGNVTTQGVVVGDFEGTTGLSGFYLQAQAGDGDPATSDGIFVFTGAADTVSEGDVVRVSGFARERFNQTALNGSNSNTAPVTNIVVCGTGSVAPTDVTLPFATATSPEAYEGMSVRLPQSLVISEYFNYERFGEVVLAQPLPGETRAFTPTAVDEPGAPALARAAINALSRITIDDGLSIQNPPNLVHPNGDPFTLTNRFRGGDTVANTVGVMGFDFSVYRIQPTGPAEYTEVNPRPATPQDVGGSVKVAAMNTLNFFLTLDQPGTADNVCGGNANLECRGADSDQPLEFTRQRDKLINTLAGIDADVLGLNELENTPGVDAVLDPVRGIVAGLNGLGGDQYAGIDTGVIGTDAIRVGLIYKPSVVTPVGAFKVLTSAVDPRFVDTKSRPALAQTFRVNATGARFTVVVNHLKSKGSDCLDIGDADAGDGQGNCNATRAQAARALVDWLATDPTGSGDDDFLIIGDLNSYAKEDPIDAIKLGSDDSPGTADDYTNLVESELGTYAYSYVFDGQAGYLDHALATAGLARQVTGVTEWHVNADEADVFDYDTSFKPPSQDALYDAGPYRASDHDPIIVGLSPSLTFDQLCQLVRAKVTKPGIATALCAQLALAEAANRFGLVKVRNVALKAFRHLVDAQTGKAITAADAAMLKALSLQLQ